MVSAALGRLGYHGPTADVIRGYVTPGLRQRGYVALALARMGRDEGSVEDFVTRMRATLEDPKVNLCSELDSQVLMAMALLDPEAAAPFAAKMREQALNKPRVPEVLACSFVLTLTGHEEHLGPVLKSTQEATREALARGIAWAVIASTAQGDFPKAPPVLDDLRLDPAPRVQAFAAVAAGHLELDGAEADLRVALCAPERLLDPPLLDQNRDFAYLARTEETSLRALLWGAHAAVKGKEPPAWRRSLSTARLLEITRQLRSGR